jgi:hypothetical protein
MDPATPARRERKTAVELADTAANTTAPIRAAQAKERLDSPL